jgi:hypothetical protein
VRKFSNKSNESNEINNRQTITYFEKIPQRKTHGCCFLLIITTLAAVLSIRSSCVVEDKFATATQHPFVGPWKKVQFLLGGRACRMSVATGRAIYPESCTISSFYLYCPLQVLNCKNHKKTTHKINAEHLANDNKHNNRMSGTSRRPRFRNQSSDDDEDLTATPQRIIPSHANDRRRHVLMIFIWLGCCACVIWSLVTAKELRQFHLQPHATQVLLLEKMEPILKPFVIDKPKQSTCDCFSVSSSCCNRKILRAHKMGVVLLRDLVYERFDIPSAIIHPKELLNATKDYRHVVVTRPLHDSMVSGYLYHKSGAECWLDQDGAPRKVNKTFPWTTDLTIPINASTKTLSLCQYLAETPEDAGMRVYVDWSWHALYAGLVPYSELARPAQKTLFVCFQQLENPTTQATVIHDMMNWLYPGGHKFALAPPITTNTDKDAAADKANANVVANIGGHATSRDPLVRQRLRALAEQYDHELLGDAAAKATKLFGCDKGVLDKRE